MKKQYQQRRFPHQGIGKTEVLYPLPQSPTTVQYLRAAMSDVRYFEIQKSSQNVNVASECTNGMLFMLRFVLERVVLTHRRVFSRFFVALFFIGLVCYSLTEVEVILKDGPILIYNDTGLVAQFSSNIFSCIGHRFTVANPSNGCSKLISHNEINKNQYGIAESAIFSNDYVNTYTFVWRGKCSLHHKAINLADAKVVGAIIVSDNEEYLEAPFDPSMKSPALIRLEKECSKSAKYRDNIMCEEKINEYKRLGIVSIMIKKMAFSKIMENIRSHRSSSMQILVYPTNYCTLIKDKNVTKRFNETVNGDDKIINYGSAPTTPSSVNKRDNNDNLNDNNRTKKKYDDVIDACQILLSGKIKNRQRNLLIENFKQLINTHDYEKYCTEIINKQEL